MKKLIVLICLIVNCTLAFGQPPSIDPPPGNTTVCPGGNGVQYRLLAGSAYHSCNAVSYTVTHGSFSSSSTVTTTTAPYASYVTVYWDDYQGNGVLSASSSCNEGTAAASATFAIRSLKGLTPEGIRVSASPNYCSTAAINVYVNVLYLPNTGAGTSFTQQMADGYEWVLPSGWTGISSSNVITISPTNGCVEGTISVRAYMNCDVKKYSDAATLVLSRNNLPTMNITPQAGYSGPSCGATGVVTFTVNNPPSCVATTGGYSWTFPPGWHVTNQVTNGNTIQAIPTGNSTDAGPITVVITTNCGKQFTGTGSLTFINPYIQVTSTICTFGSPVGLIGVTPTTPVVWSVSSNANITGGQGTQTVTLSAPYVGSIGYGTVSAVATCSGLATPIQGVSVWVGTPSQPGTISGPTTPTIGNITNYVVYPAPQGAPTYDWIMPFYGDPVWSWAGGGISGPINTLTPNFTVGSSSGYLQMYGINNCGNSAVTRIRVFPQGGVCTTCPRIAGDPSSISEDEIDSTYTKVAVYPNPTSTEFTVRLKERTTREASLDLIDSGGDVKKSLLVSPGTQFVRVNVNEILAGIYVVRVKEGFKTYSKKILIQH